MRAEFLYRDAANYKKWMTVELPEGFRDLKEDDEVDMEEVGVVPRDVWSSFIGGYDPEDDHTTLEFIRYVPESENPLEITQQPVKGRTITIEEE